MFISFSFLRPKEKEMNHTLKGILIRTARINCYTASRSFASDFASLYIKHATGIFYVEFLTQARKEKPALFKRDFKTQKRKFPSTPKISNSVR